MVDIFANACYIYKIGEIYRGVYEIPAMEVSEMSYELINAAAEYIPYVSRYPYTFEFFGMYFPSRVPLSTWFVSQGFAFISMIFSIWSWQIKDKVKMMFLLGMFTSFFVMSAFLLQNYTLAVLFGLAAIRNFVFCYLDWRTAKGKHVAGWLRYMFAGIFAVTTIGSTVLLVHIIQVDIVSVWLEWLIGVTLLGLVAGNIMKGTHLMRVSFVFNRTFNIVNHLYFNNVIAAIIALLSIGSILVFYIRLLVERMRNRGESEEQLQVDN